MRRGLPFSINKGRDGSSKQRWHFQVLGLTFRLKLHKHVSGVMAISLACVRKAVTEATLAWTVPGLALFGGVVQENNLKGAVVSDSANSEKKTNRLEDNKLHVPRLAHISGNIGKHGVKDHHVSCLCGLWDQLDGVGPTDSVQCKSCHVGAHDMLQSHP